MSAQVWFTVRQPLNRESGDVWNNYVRWSLLSHCKEILSLDYMLCPNLLFIDEDEPLKYQYLLLRDLIVTDLYSDLGYVMSKLERTKRANLLAVQLMDEGAIESPVEGFEFVGYDLVDKSVEVSALTNCGGFPEVFASSELNESGLVTSLQRARTIQADLLLQNPGERHAECDLWSVSVRRLGPVRPSSP